MFLRECRLIRCAGVVSECTENAGPENVGPEMQDQYFPNTRSWKNARLKNGEPIMWM